MLIYLITSFFTLITQALIIGTKCAYIPSSNHNKIIKLIASRILTMSTGLKTAIIVGNHAIVFAFFMFFVTFYIRFYKPDIPLEQTSSNNN